MFPKDFLWGASTSSHQVEGSNKNNDWWKWETEGKLKEPSGNACNQYNLYKEDFKLAESLSHNAHRFSLEWSRIEPEEGKFDKEALDHYRGIIQNLRSLGMEPVVTINHFTLPVWLFEKGGWLAEKSEHIFNNFVEKTVTALGKDVTYWITLNEPAGNIYSAYIEGSWPPGRHSLGEAAKVFTILLKAHALSYNTIHRIYKENHWKKPKVSIAKHVLLFSPCRRNSLQDNFSKNMRHFYFNRLFIESLLSGWCIAPGMPLTRLPARKSLDFVGLNYYTRDFVHYAGLSPMGVFGNVCTLTHHKDKGKRNFLKWEIYPEGIYNVLMQCSKYKLPILITENGICANNDSERTDFIKGHLKEVSRAIKDNAPVFGYMHWSLLDNFEWAHGYGPRFGLIEIDYATETRTVRPSAYAYAEIIKKNSI